MADTAVGTQAATGEVPLSTAERRLRVIFQRQGKEPRIILSPQFRGDAKAKINSRCNAAGGDAITVLHHTVNDKLRSKLRQEVAY